MDTEVSDLASLLRTGRINAAVGWALTGVIALTAVANVLLGNLLWAGFAAWARRRWIGVVPLAGVVALGASTGGVVALGASTGGVVALGASTGGVVGGAVATLFVAGGVLIATIASRTGLSARSILGAAVLGLAVHPFTGLLTGEPPAFFAPWDVPLVGGRIEPFADPTANLLAAFGAEVAVIWFGLLVGLSAREVDPRRHVHLLAAVVVYAPMAFVLEGVSVDDALPFVATILPIGGVGVVGWRRS